jgi:hypothetical protein
MYFTVAPICHWDDFESFDCRLHVATEYSGDVLPSGVITWRCGTM